MSKLTLKRGGDETSKLLEEHKDIVHFLTSPFTPCIVYRKKEDYDVPVATNIGDLGIGFRSYVGDPLYYFEGDKYVIEYMADDKIIIKTAHDTPPTNTLKQLGQPGFSELYYDGNVEDILAEFVNVEYKIVDIAPQNLKIYYELQRQRNQNLEAQEKTLDNHYIGRRISW